MPGMTKSALCVARDALAAGEASLAFYDSRFSRLDWSTPCRWQQWTQPVWRPGM